MIESLVVVGGGEHARVLVEAARSRPDRWQLAGFIDPQPCPPMQALGVPWLGDDARALAGGPGDRAFVIGVGTVGVGTRRQELAARYAELGARFATVVHAQAVVSPSASVGAGAVVFAGAVVNAGATLGEHVIVNTGAIVEHDVRLGAFVHVGPAAALGGGAVIGEGSYLGLGCRVRDHITIGARVTVGMGAVVIGPITDESTALGCPARERRS